MFGFLISAEVNDDSVKVKTLMDMALQKYASLPEAQLKLSIANDFDKDYCDVDTYYVTFVYRELEDFLFSLETTKHDGIAPTLSVSGRGKYAGIMIQATTDGDWYSNVSGGVAYQPTGGARSMAKIMEKKFGVTDMTKRLAGL